VCADAGNNDRDGDDEEDEQGGVAVAKSDPPKGQPRLQLGAEGGVGWTAGDGTTDGKGERAERCRA